MGWVGFVVLLAHVGVGALWLGSMTYSLFVVQPRIARVVTNPVAAEDLYRELGAGNRWRVIGLIATLLASGALLLVAPHGSVHDRQSWPWWLAIGVKVALLATASLLFWWVSWRGWPRRVFALPAELPVVQQRFRRVAITMVALVGAAFVIGVAAAHLR